jgi:putative SOS response-associated peptidase YedK
MCTNFTPTADLEWVRQHFGVDLPEGGPEECFPGYLAPLIVRGPHSGRMGCGLARFGLIPGWAKDDRIARHTYNARSETAAVKPSFRSAWRGRRYGLVLVDDFFEPSYETGRAVRWRIGLASGGPFGIACLWDRWEPPQGGERVVSFSMLTVNADAHPVMKRFHREGDEKRTPLIIPPEQHKAWLQATPAEAEAMMSWSGMPELSSAPAPRAAASGLPRPADQTGVQPFAER